MTRLPMLALSLCACASAGLPDVVDPLDIKAQSGTPTITRIRDAGSALVPRIGAIDAVTDGVASAGELLVVDGRGFGRQPTVLVGGRPAEVLGRTRGGGVVVRVPRGVPTGLVDVSVTTSGGAARLATPMRRVAVAVVADKLRYVTVGTDVTVVAGTLPVPGARAVRIDGSGAVAFVLADQGAASRVTVVDLGRTSPSSLGTLEITHRANALATAALASRLVVVGDASLTLVDTTSVRRPVFYDAVPLPREAFGARAAELSPDGRVLALLLDGNRVAALDVSNPGPAQLVSVVDVLPGERQALARALAFSPDGQTLWVVSGASAETHPQVIPTRITAVKLIAAYAGGVADGGDRPAPPVGPIRRSLAVWKTQTVAGGGAPLGLAVGHPPEAGGSAIRDTPEVASVLLTEMKDSVLALKSGAVDPARVARVMGGVDVGFVMHASLGDNGSVAATTHDVLGPFATTPDATSVVALALHVEGDHLVVGVESLTLDRPGSLQLALLTTVSAADLRQPFHLGLLALQP